MLINLTILFTPRKVPVYTGQTVTFQWTNGLPYDIKKEGYLSQTPNLY